MEYTIKKLSKIAGVTTRTLRYYDEMGLLKPARINSSGYRIYGPDEVDRLQQILFYRELGLDLGSIKKIVTSPFFDTGTALREHRAKLLNKRQQLDSLIINVDKSIAVSERRLTMADNEKFEGFKQNLISENEKKYGEEIRAKYGNEQVDLSNNKFQNLTPEQYEETERLSAEITDLLAQAFKTGDPSSELAQKTAKLHKKWLCYFWESYSPEAHAGLAQMYVDDPRFSAYYDSAQLGSAQFLRDAIFIYTGMNK